jgi:hypothetical protein
MRFFRLNRLWPQGGVWEWWPKEAKEGEKRWAGVRHPSIGPVVVGIGIEGGWDSILMAIPTLTG